MISTDAKRMTWHAWTWNPWVEEMLALGRSVAVKANYDASEIEAESMPIQIAQ